MQFIRIIAALIALACSPAFAQVTPGAGPATVAKGGTGKSSLDAHKLIFGAGASPVTLYGCTGFLVGTGTGADPTCRVIAGSDLPNPSASTLGGTQSKTCSASQWLNAISTGGVPGCTQPNFTDLAGSASVAQLPAFSGMSSAAAASDTDTFPTNQGAGNLKQTFAAIKTWIKAWIVKADVGLGNVDNTSDATKWAATKTLTNTTYNCAGTGNVCTVRFADITGFGTGVSTALGVNVGSAGAFVVNGGALGTPSAGIATNLTGTASGLTAGNVTTNANMTGDVTSVGNVTTLTNAPVIAKVLTAFSAGAGTVSSSDSILTAFQKVVGNIALKLNAASPAMTGTADVQGTLKLSAFVTSTQLTANANDYTATDGSNTCSTKTTLRISTNASRNITGLSCGQAEGDVRIIHNVGAQAAVLTNQDVSSTAANRFLFGGDMTLAADTSVTIRYDGVTSRWRAITTPGAGGGGGGVTSVTVAAGEGVALTGTCTITTSGTCTVARSDPARWNELLNLIYQSKSFAEYRRLANLFATGFKGASDALNGILTGSSSNYTVTPGTAGATTGNVAPTVTAGSDQTSTHTTATTGGNTASASSSIGAGFEAWRAFDKVIANGTGGAGTWISNSTTTGYLQYQFGSAKTIGSYTLTSANAFAARMASAWTLKGSATGAFAGEETTLDTRSGESSWTAGGQTRSYTIASPASFTYYRLTVTANNGDGTFLEIDEMTLVSTSVTNNMTLVTTAQTADSSVANGRILLEYDNTASPSINTDLTAEVTCNGGTNWAAATLSAVTANGQGGRKVVETADTACTSGTDFRARIKTLNNKNIPISGLSLTVR